MLSSTIAFLEPRVEANGIVRIPQPPSSPDLEHSDLWLFGDLEPAVADSSFKQTEDVLGGLADFLDRMGPQNIRATCEKWMRGVIWVLNND
jgi:hypothetical protein